MSVILRQPLTLAECQLVREWRNDPAVLPMLRTGYKTEEEQDQFYREVICQQWTAPHLYYGIHVMHSAASYWLDEFVGMGGLTHLDRKTGQAEISLIIGPRHRGRGYGSEAVDALLAEAWRIGLTSVRGECYATGNQSFWRTQLARIGQHQYAQFNRQDSLIWTWNAPELTEHGYGAGV